MTGLQRGSAIAETAVATGLALLIVFNGIQLALLGFNQLHVDAAAFTAARVMAITGNATTAQTAATNAVPPAVDSYAISTPSPALAQAITTKSGGGILFVPGASTSVTVRGEHQEPVPSAAAVSGFSFAFGFRTATLQNFFPQGVTNAAAHTVPTIYPAAPGTLGLAHNVNLTGNGQGVNGVFAEWNAHQKCYALVNFPASYDTTQTDSTDSAPQPQYTTFAASPGNPKKAANPGNPTETVIYGWDTNGSGSGAC